MELESTPISINVIQPNAPISDIRGNEVDIIDFALSTTESLLVLGMNQSLDLIRKVSKLGRYEESLHLI